MRYFLLFCFYLLVGVVYMFITLVSVWDHYSFKSEVNKATTDFLIILDILLIIILVPFNVENMYFAA